MHPPVPVAVREVRVAGVARAKLVAAAAGRFEVGEPAGGEVDEDSVGLGQVARGLRAG